MKFLFWHWLWLGLLGWPGAALAQDVLLPYDQPQSTTIFHQLLPDSLAALERYRTAGRYPAVERVATFLLTRYPGRVAFASPKGPADPPFYYPNYPQTAYARRATARTDRRDFRGAEADLTQVLRYAPPAPAGPEPSAYAFDSPPLALLRDTYYARASLRLDFLNNRAGGCADLGASYQLDTLRASHPRWRGCPLPPTRRPVGWHFEPMQKLAEESVSRVLLYLDTNQPDKAAALLAQLRQGRVGPFTGVPVNVSNQYEFSLRYHPERELALLHIRLARQLGRYARARTALDSLISATVYNPHLPNQRVPLYRRERAGLLLDALRDPAGCDDVRWLYAHPESGNGDSARWPASWRRCPLPRYRVPVGDEEVKAYRLAYENAVAQAALLIASKNPAQIRVALDLLTRLLTTQQVGPFVASPNPPDPEQYVSGYAKSVISQLPPTARMARSRAYEALADYPRAVADLDTLIASGQGGPAHCRRGLIRADYLHDRAGACADLGLCYRQRGWPGAKLPSSLRRWRGCVIPERDLGHRLAIADKALRLGYFSQGAVKGGEVGCYFYTEGVTYNLSGPSAGLELGGGNGQFILGPKLSYEGNLGLIAGRLDLTYYTANFQVGDLRLTPQAGLSLWGTLNVFYGYALPLTGTELPGLGRHRLSISINFLDNGPGFKIGG